MKFLFLWAVTRKGLVTILLLLALASPAWGAFAFVGGTVTNPGVSTVRTVTTNDLLILGKIWGDITSTPTITNAGGQTWTQIGSILRDTPGGVSTMWWWAVSVTTGSITVDTSDTANADAQFIGEWSGNATSAPTDGNAGQDAAGTDAVDNNTTTNMTTAVNGDLIIGFIGDDGLGRTTGVFTAGTNYTKRAAASSDPGGAGNWTWFVEDRVQATAGAIAATATNANSPNRYLAQGAAFKVAGGAAAVPERTKMGVGQ